MTDNLFSQKEILERLVTLEAQGATLLKLAEQTREDAQRTAGVVDALAALERRHVSLESAVRMQWGKVDPLVHSDPPVTARIRVNEQELADLRAVVRQVVAQVDEARDTARRLTWTVATFVLVGVLNAAVQFGGVVP